MIALSKKHLKYETEKEYCVDFKNKKVGKFRADFVVENQVIVEIKAINGRLPKIFEHQILSYLKASGLSVGLLINFGSTRCDVRRLIAHHKKSRSSSP
jgi:GxxExxY protein